MMPKFSKLKFSLNWRSWKLWLFSITLIVVISLVYLLQQPSLGTIKVISPQTAQEQKEEMSKWEKARQEIAKTMGRREEEEKRKEGSRFL